MINFFRIPLTPNQPSPTPSEPQTPQSSPIIPLPSPPNTQEQPHLQPPNRIITISRETDYQPPAPGDNPINPTSTITLKPIQVPLNVYDPKWSVNYQATPLLNTKAFTDLSSFTQTEIVHQLQELNSKLYKIGVRIRDLRNFTNPFFTCFY